MRQRVSTEQLYLVPGQIEFCHRNKKFVGHSRVPHSTVVCGKCDRNSATQILGEWVLLVAINVSEHQVADQVDLHQVGAVPHEAHRVVIANQVQAMADSVGTQQQGFADVRIGLVNFAGVDRKLTPLYCRRRSRIVERKRRG